jgi:PGF-CTERM protein
MYADGNHTLRVWAFDEWGQSAKSEGVLIIVDNNMPYIMILSGGGEKWGNYVIRANVTDPHLNTSCVKAKIGNADPVQMSFNGEEWRYTVNTNNLPNGPITIMVMACDYRGNMNPGEMVEIIVENRADLRILSVEWVKDEVEEGQTIRVKVTVTNEGHSSANNFEVVAMEGTKQLANATEVSGLNPGKEHTFTLSWKAKGTGTKTILLKVDTKGAVEEIDETNNGWEQQQVKVVEESPGFGILLAALALLAVVTLLRRRR